MTANGRSFAGNAFGKSRTINTNSPGAGDAEGSKWTVFAFCQLRTRRHRDRAGISVGGDQIHAPEFSPRIVQHTAR